MMEISRKASNYLLFTGVFFFILILSLSNCTSDQLPQPTAANCETMPPTYDLEVRPIIDVSCAYSGCHLDDPSAPGEFDTYGGLQDYLEEKINTFRQRVITGRGNGITGMPPNSAPEGRPIDLTEEQVNTIECWLDAGYPEF